MLAIKSGNFTTSVPGDAAVQQLFKADTAELGENFGGQGNLFEVHMLYF